MFLRDWFITTATPSRIPHTVLKGDLPTFGGFLVLFLHLHDNFYKVFITKSLRFLPLYIFMHFSTVYIDTRLLRSNTHGNVSKISVNQSSKGFLTTFLASDHESEMDINTFYSAAKTPRPFYYIFILLFKYQV